MDIDIGRWIVLPQLPTTRRLRIFHGVLRIATEIHNTALQAIAREATAHDEKTLVEEGRWFAYRDGKLPSDPVHEQLGVHDQFVDGNLSGLSMTVKGPLLAFGRESELGTAAEKIDTTLFPEGVGAVTRLAYEEQLPHLDRIVAALEGPLAAEVGLLNLQRYVDQLKSQTAEYRTLVERRTEAQRTISFSDVKESRRVGQNNLLRCVARILGDYNGDDSDSLGLRERLLTPVDHHAQIVLEARRRRRRVTEVDVETGDELPDADDPPADP